jgi:hypothetical protein
MIANSWWGRVSTWSVLGAVVLAGHLHAQGETLANSVRIPQGVVANGQPLPAGTYTLRVSSEPVTPVVGQGPDSARWVEFVQNGQVRGKELATVVAPADVKVVAKRTPPAQGVGLVHVLRGSEFVRVWVNHGGSQYLVHLTVSAGR